MINYSQTRNFFCEVPIFELVFQNTEVLCLDGAFYVPSGKIVDYSQRSVEPFVYLFVLICLHLLGFWVIHGFIRAVRHEFLRT